MKTRNGFVSNSSSSSFMVTFKEDFKVTQEIFDKLDIDVDDEDDEDGEEVDGYTVESVNELFEEFKRCGISNYEEYTDYNIISQLCDDYGIQVGPSFEGGPDNGDSIEYISPADLQDILNQLKS